MSSDDEKDCSSSGDVECDEDDLSEYTYSDDEVYEMDEGVDESSLAQACAISASSSAQASIHTSTDNKAKASRSSKAAVDLSALDEILSRCDDAFPVKISAEEETFLNLVTHRKTPRKVDVVSKESSTIKRKNAAAAEKEASIAKTSTLKAGVGYETGLYDPSSSTTLQSHMRDAAEKQRVLDKQCQNILKCLISFIDDFNGDEGFVLIALKMSRGLNRMLFSLLKTGLKELGERWEVHLAAFEFLEKVCTSKFLVSFLVHDLLEGDGTDSGMGISNCLVLMTELNRQADIIRASQEKFLSDVKDAKGGKDKEKELARHTVLVCNQIGLTLERVNNAVTMGREVGTISEEMDPNFARKKRATGDEKEGGMTDKELSTKYCEVMRNHRFVAAPIVDAVEKKKASHYHVDSNAISTDGSVQPQRMMRIHSELTSLSSDLPVEWASSIFVRYDEDRPDVMKACIMAPESTPYENGCFEFDIFLPLSYPREPPKVHLVTTDQKRVRFNPNLYRDGKVCLSLLGTWSGPGWIPETSTLLQVLVSIQSLIFVQDPYFNEPGYDAAQITHQEKSKYYDERIRAATLKVAILGQLEKPSSMFRDCIRDHFRLKRRRLLQQLSEWEDLARLREAEKMSPNNFRDGAGIPVSGSKTVEDLCKKIHKQLDFLFADSKKGSSK